MEIKRRKKLYHIFISFLLVLCAELLVTAVAVFCGMLMLISAGQLYPANYAQTRLEEAEETLKTADKITAAMLPPGCEFGVYDKAGEWLYGTFAGDQREKAWEYQKNDKVMNLSNTVYRSVKREDGETFVVRYTLLAQFKNQRLRQIFPNPERASEVLYVLVVLVETVLTARQFGKYLAKRLKVLDETTGRIKHKDLEFDRAYSDIREIDDVLGSLYEMKEALKKSLTEQWDMENRKKEQAAALAHDIKTPLTVIRGNAELISEAASSVEAREYNGYVIQSVQEIEEYLKVLQQMLNSDGESAENIQEISIAGFTDRIAHKAQTLGRNKHIAIDLQYDRISGTMKADEDHIYRAVMNILSNAEEHTPAKGRILVRAEVTEDLMLTIIVADSGPGFTKEEMEHGTEQFFQSDKSRHSKAHYGMGLYIAKMFIEQQGGSITLSNSEETKGAEVTVKLEITGDSCH